MKVEWAVVNANVKEAVGRFLCDQIRSRPLILPVPMEV